MTNSKLKQILDKLSHGCIIWEAVYDINGIGFETKINNDLFIQIGFSSAQSKTPSIQIKIKEGMLLFPDINENTSNGKEIMSFYDVLLRRHHNNILSKNDVGKMILDSVDQKIVETNENTINLD